MNVRILKQYKNGVLKMIDTTNNRIAANRVSFTLDVLSEELGVNALIDDICSRLEQEQLISILTEIAAENSFLEDINEAEALHIT